VEKQQGRKSKSSIQIINSSGNEMCIIHEPECFEFALMQQDEISIEFNAKKNSIAPRHSIENWICVISLLPGNSNYTVLHKGIDV
jgi:hypothetical protein